MLHAKVQSLKGVELLEGGDRFLEKLQFEGAVASYKEAADLGLVEAQQIVAFLFKMGHGCEQSYKKAAKYFIKATKQGDAYSHYQIAILYENGWGVGQSEKAAVEHYILAASQDYLPALEELAGRYYLGLGVSCSHKEVWRYLNQCFKANPWLKSDGLSEEYWSCFRGIREYVESCYKYGHICARALLWAAFEYKVDYSSRLWRPHKLEKYFNENYSPPSMLAKQDYPFKRTFIADFVQEYWKDVFTYSSEDNKHALEACYSSFSRTVNFREAHAVWHMFYEGTNDLDALLNAAYQGNIFAQKEAGHYYKWIQPDPEKAFYYYSLAAVQGDWLASQEVVECYISGSGVERSNEKAFEYFSQGSNYKPFTSFEEAAARGDPRAYFFLGLLASSDSETLHYHSLAAGKRDVKGTVAMGKRYQYGKGVEKNLSKALVYYQRAAEYEDFTALKEIAYLCSLREVLIHPFRWVGYLKRAADLGDGFAQIKLDILYDHYGYSWLAMKYNTLSSYISSAVLQHKHARRLLDKGKIQDYHEVLTLAADKGDIEAQKELAHCYGEGTVIPKSSKKEMHYIKMAADHGDAFYQYKTGFAFETGCGQERSLEKAIVYYEQAALQGQPNALIAMGDLYFKGRGKEQSYTKAFEYYQRALAGAPKTAHHRLGLCYKQGYGVQKDPQQAFEHFQSADFSEGYYQIGLCFLEGSGVEKSNETAYNYLWNASEEGCSKAYFDISQLIVSRRDEAFFLLLSRWSGDPRAHDYLTTWFDPEEEEFKEALTFAFEYLKQKEAKGWSWVYQALGRLYEKGWIAPKNISTAIMYYTQACQRGSKMAYVYLGWIYENSFEVERDVERAFAYYSAGVKAGAPEALNALGMCYEMGLGTKRDDITAFKLYSKGVTLGLMRSYARLGMCFECGTGVERDTAKAVQLYQKAAPYSAAAAEYLARCYEEGAGVEKSPQKALYYHELSDELEKEGGRWPW